MCHQTDSVQPCGNATSGTNMKDSKEVLSPESFNHGIRLEPSTIDNPINSGVSISTEMLGLAKTVIVNGTVPEDCCGMVDVGVVSTTLLRRRPRANAMSMSRPPSLFPGLKRTLDDITDSESAPVKRRAERRPFKC